MLLLYSPPKRKIQKNSAKYRYLARLVFQNTSQGSVTFKIEHRQNKQQVA